jgi:hypothetical protein
LSLRALSLAFVSLRNQWEIPVNHFPSHFRTGRKRCVAARWIERSGFDVGSSSSASEPYSRRGCGFNSRRRPSADLSRQNFSPPAAATKAERGPTLWRDFNNLFDNPHHLALRVLGVLRTSSGPMIRAPIPVTTAAAFSTSCALVASSPFARKLSSGRGVNALFHGHSGTGKTMARDHLGRWISTRSISPAL